LAGFFTYLTMVLRKLSHLSASFLNAVGFIKSFAHKISEDSNSPCDEFNVRFFFKSLLKNYCNIINDQPNKRSAICEVLFAHSSQDLNLRIKIVQDLKNYVKDEEVVYSCYSHLISQETEFNEEWFDVFLYYALIGLNSSRAYIRVYSLNILNSIAKLNIEGVLEISEKIAALSKDNFWEVKAQCLIFSAHVLRYLKTYQNVLAAGKDNDNKLMAPSPSSGNNRGNRPGSRGGAQAAGGLDRNSAKRHVATATTIVNNCFNISSPKSVQKLGLFEIQGILNDYKNLYYNYLEVLLSVDSEVRNLLLSDEYVRSKSSSLND
jgi:hypothetical protein